MIQIDAPKRKIKRSEILYIRNKLRILPSMSSEDEELNNQIFQMRSDFPLVYAPREDVFGPPRFPIFELPYEWVWAYEKRFQYTHMDDDFNWWIEPGHEIKEGKFQNPDGTVLVEERPDYLGKFEDAEQLRTRMLEQTLMYMNEIERGVENDCMNYGWAVTLTDVAGKEISREEADEAPRGIVTAVLSALLEYPQHAWGIDIVE